MHANPGYIQRWFFTLLIAIVLLWGLFLIASLLFPMPELKPYSKVIHDKNGQLLYAFLTPDDKWRLETREDEISPLLKKTLLAKEDKYFYQHPGINPLAIARAAFRNVIRLKRTSGASTITMQVARMLEPRPRTYMGKLTEMFRAIQLELRYDKETILQLYLSMVPYGGNIEGVKAASLLYFNKNPDHLSLAEITALSIIPNRPSSLVIGKHNDRILAERNRWLKKFEAEKVFTRKEITDALEEPLTAERRQFPRRIPHLARKLNALADNEFHTTIDAHMQDRVETLVKEYMRSMKLRKIHNAAVVIIHNPTREILTYVGSADFYDSTDGGQVNGAAAIRQPGSTLKPLLYGLCIDEGLVTPASVIHDVPVNFMGYRPENYDRRLRGNVSLSYALEHSLNIPAVKSLQLLGVETMIETLTRADFRQISKDRRKLGLSMVLGGCGSTLEELTGLYSAMATSGIYSKPVVLKGQASSVSKPLLSEASSWMITDILSRIHRPDFPLNWQSTERMPKIAWKTGTSYGRRDAWSIGYNKEYTVGVWTGNFSGTGVTDLNGTSIATPLLFRIFNMIDYDSDREWFSRPDDCATRVVCAETGLLPSAQCTNFTGDEYIPLISSTRTCDHLQEVLLSPDGRISYCMTCKPETGYRKKYFKKTDPEMQAFYEDQRMRYEKIPEHNPSCERIFRSGVPVIQHPVSGNRYYLSSSNPEPLLLKAAVEADVGRVYWYINNRFYQSASPSTGIFFIPEAGSVKISCTDDKGRNRDIIIDVQYADL